MLSAEDESIGVLIVDDHAVVRRGVVSYLQVVENIDVVGEAVDGEAALKLLEEMAVLGELPDVVLMDLLMPRLDGAAATAEITRRFPDVRVVILTSFGEVERVHVALENGASGYLLKDAGPPEVAEAIRAAARDEVFLDAAVARKLATEMRRPNSGLGALTQRERDVLVLLADGRSNREIAAELVISERTARTHVSNLLGKLNLKSRTQAVLLAIKEGLVPPSL